MQYYSPSDGWKRWIHAFSKSFARSESQTVSSRIWTRVTDFIFIDNNSYAKRAIIIIYMYVCRAISMYICVYKYVYMYVCIYVSIDVHIYVYLYVCMYVWVLSCMYVCMYVWVYICMYVCMHIRSNFRSSFLRCDKRPNEWGTIYPTPPLGQDMTQGQFLSWV